MRLEIQENGLYFVFELQEDKPAYLLHMGAEPMTEEPEEGAKPGYNIQEVQVTGESRVGHMGVSPVGTLPGHRMFYVGHTD